MLGAAARRRSGAGAQRRMHLGVRLGEEDARLEHCDDPAHHNANRGVLHDGNEGHEDHLTAQDQPASHSTCHKDLLTAPTPPEGREDCPAAQDRPASRSSDATRERGSSLMGTRFAQRISGVPKPASWARGSHHGHVQHHGHTVRTEDQQGAQTQCATRSTGAPKDRARGEMQGEGGATRTARERRECGAQRGVAPCDAARAYEGGRGAHARRGGHARTRRAAARALRVVDLNGRRPAHEGGHGVCARLCICLGAGALRNYSRERVRGGVKGPAMMGTRGYSLVVRPPQCEGPGCEAPGMATKAQRHHDARGRPCNP